MKEQNYYQILGVTPDVDFQGLKKAYYRQAKQCHPDRFAGDPIKEEHFKRLVKAFDVLSDPVQRRNYEQKPTGNRADSYDRRHGFGDGSDEQAIMDTFADDILEELIVGNTIPRNTTLETLLLDLENTEKFLRFREGKNLFYNGHINKANTLFFISVQNAPNNILYRYYLAKSYALLKRWRKSEKELQVAIRLGATRVPPLRLTRFHKELTWLRQNHRGILGRLRAQINGTDHQSLLPEDEKLRRRTARMIDRIHRENQRHERKRLKD